MTLRYDDRGRPVGLDWGTLSANCPQDPSIWSRENLNRERRAVNRLPDETEMLIVRMHLDGATAAQICDAVDCSAPTVAAVLDRREITERRGRGTTQRTPDDVADEIVRLYVNELLPGAEIGRRVGIAHATVYKILRRRGIEPRNQGERPRGRAA